MSQPNATREAIAQRLRAARARVYKTAADAALAVGIKAVTLRAHESGQNGASPEDLVEYASKYGVSLSWLVTGEGSAEPSAEFDEPIESDLLEVSGYLDDDYWLRGSPESKELPQQPPVLPTGGIRVVSYTDPRFPADHVSAYIVRSPRADGEYSNGTIVFAVDLTDDYPAETGDHVIIAEIKDTFVRYTLCLLEYYDAQAGDVVLRPLLNERPLIQYKETSDAGDQITALSIVIGLTKRRDARPYPASERRLAAQQQVRRLRSYGL